MVPTTTREDLRTAVQDQIHGTLDKTGTTIIDRILNRAVREVLSKIDLRTTKRSIQLSLAGMNDVIYEETDGTYDLPTVQAIAAQANQYEFACPNDMKGVALIDIAARTDRALQYRLTTQEEFDRRKAADNQMVAFAENATVRKLLVSGGPTIDSAFIHNCDTYNGDGTFTAVGGSSSIATEVSEYVEGDGAVSFNTDLGTATAGIQNTAFTAVDLTDYEDQDIFVWVKLPSASLITSFTLRWGSDSSNYWERTVNRTHESLAFYDGWNLLRFSWADATKVGTPLISAIDFVSFFMTKDVSKAAVTGVIVDRIIAMKNSDTDALYYSKYGWQTEDGIWIAQATADSDLLNADEDEIDLIVNHASKLASIKIGNKDDVALFGNLFNEGMIQYTSRYPSEAQTLTTEYHRFASLSGSASDDD